MLSQANSWPHNWWVWLGVMPALFFYWGNLWRTFLRFANAISVMRWFSACSSIFCNLTFSIYMLRVLWQSVNSVSTIPTLYVITFAAVVALMTLAVLEWIRSRLLIRTGVEFERRLSASILNMELRSAADLEKKADRGEIRDVQTLRSFLGSNAVFAYFDIPGCLSILSWFSFSIPLLAVSPSRAACAHVITFGVLTQKIAGPKLQEASEANPQGSHASGQCHTQCRDFEGNGNDGRHKALAGRPLIKKSWACRQGKQACRPAPFHQQVHAHGPASCYLCGWRAISPSQTRVQRASWFAASIVMGRALAPIDELWPRTSNPWKRKRSQKR